MRQSIETGHKIGYTDISYCFHKIHIGLCKPEVVGSIPICSTIYKE